MANKYKIFNSSNPVEFTFYDISKVLSGEEMEFFNNSSPEFRNKTLKEVCKLLEESGFNLNSWEEIVEKKSQKDEVLELIDKLEKSYAPKSVYSEELDKVIERLTRLLNYWGSPTNPF